MKTELLIEMIAELTQSGYVDAKVLLETIENNDLDIYEIMNELRANFWEQFQNQYNWIMYEVLSSIGRNFIESHEELFENDGDREYEVFTNYCDSHIWFNDEAIEEEFEKFIKW